MKKHALGLTIATLLLTACGGSDSNDNPAVDPGKPNNGGNNPPTAPGKNDNTPSAPNDSGKNNDGSSQLIPPPVNQGGQQNKDKAVGQFQGKAFVVPLGKQPNGLADAQSVGSDKLNVLNINGKQLPLEIANIRAGNMLRMQNSTVDGKSYKLFVVSGTIYQNQKFGYINDGNEDYIFSQGAPTANMPTAGVAKYSGAAAVGRAAVADTALANFSANFGEKMLTGSITKNANGQIDFNPINIAADINGNSFSTKSDAAVRSTGSFYGDNARELGGIFQDSTQTLSGSFGAVRTSTSSN